uniref:Uncharacterized protein n=1 Tax=Candidatus Kentrum sp. LFY TaxID=2126342 RepID=A0A450UKR9_9GAMM|nr:MAG: hypothetical protein BECKLFY1418A_GA0070994_102821 [Candidatus Kentron sp. LFY]
MGAQNAHLLRYHEAFSPPTHNWWRLAGGHNPNFCIRLFREIPLGHGAGWFRFGIEIGQIKMEQVMVESFDATPCYLGPQFVVKPLR